MYLEKNHHAAKAGLEVKEFVETAVVFQVHEERHAEYRVDEHD